MAKQAPRPIHGRVVALTGGARGIGRATARALAAAGARVAIGDLDSELARRTAAEIGGDCFAAHLDVTDRDSFARFLEAAEDRLGAVDVLVNNAGIMPLGPFHEESDETAIRQVDINLHGVITGTKLALHRMRPRGAGHVVNLASYAGKVAPPGGATYIACKHAVVGLTASVAYETRDDGIDCTVVMPGVVNTELAAGLPQSRGVKWVEPEDVADAIVEAIRRPRLEVYVPRELGPLWRVGVLLPRRAQEWLARATKGDRILADADFSRRSAYESRAARSEPSLSPDADAAGDVQRPPDSAGAPAPAGVETSA